MVIEVYSYLSILIIVLYPLLSLALGDLYSVTIATVSSIVQLVLLVLTRYRRNSVLLILNLSVQEITLPLLFHKCSLDLPYITIFLFIQLLIFIQLNSGFKELTFHRQA